MNRATHVGSGYEINVRNRSVVVELLYPPYYPGDPHSDRDPQRPYAVEVGLSSVRAADNLRLIYDFDRDGWRIEQASVFAWECADTVQDPDWQEVAFVQAWGREKGIKE